MHNTSFTFSLCCPQAVVFDGEVAAYDSIMAGNIKPGQVMVIRYEGPQGR